MVINRILKWYNSKVKKNSNKVIEYPEVFKEWYLKDILDKEKKDKQEERLRKIDDLRNTH